MLSRVEVSGALVCDENEEEERGKGRGRDEVLRASRRTVMELN